MLMCDTDVVLDSVYKKIDAIVFSPESNDYKVSRIIIYKVMRTNKERR